MSAENVLCLTTCDQEMKASGGVTLPREGKVSGPSGLLWGEGQGWRISAGATDRVWVVFEAAGDDIAEVGGGMVRVPEATVVMVGDREEVTTWLAERAPGRGIVGLTATAGYAGTATAGYAGTATAGDRGTATAGDRGTATAGDDGTATAGDRGTATAGDRGTATAGYAGTATAGDRGTATAGDDGTATAGDDGTVLIRRWNGKRYKWIVGEIAETLDAAGKTLEPNVAYRLDANGGFIAVPVEAAEDADESSEAA
jgi:hypothetical protein